MVGLVFLCTTAVHIPTGSILPLFFMHVDAGDVTWRHRRLVLLLCLGSSIVVPIYIWYSKMDCCGGQLSHFFSELLYQCCLCCKHGVTKWHQRSPFIFSALLVLAVYSLAHSWKHTYVHPPLDVYMGVNDRSLSLSLSASLLVRNRWKLSAPPNLYGCFVRRTVLFLTNACAGWLMDWVIYRDKKTEPPWSRPWSSDRRIQGICIWRATSARWTQLEQIKDRGVMKIVKWCW